MSLLTPQVSEVPGHCGPSLEMSCNCGKSPVLLLEEAMKTSLNESEQASSLTEEEQNPGNISSVLPQKAIVGTLT